MAMVRYEIHVAAARMVRQDLRSLQVSERMAAKLIGISNSTLNAFLNVEYRTTRKRTIEVLLQCSVWSDDTKTALRKLRDYEVSLFRHRVAGEFTSKSVSVA